MKPADCTNWIPPAPRHVAGMCRLGIAHRPSYRFCTLVCEHYDGSAEERDAEAEDAASVRPGTPLTQLTIVGRDGVPRPYIPIVRWLGIRWYGIPMPLRMWAAWAHFDPGPWRAPGCGCIKRLKDAWVKWGPKPRPKRAPTPTVERPAPAVARVPARKKCGCGATA